MFFGKHQPFNSSVSFCFIFEDKILYVYQESRELLKAIKIDIRSYWVFFLMFFAKKSQGFYNKLKSKVNLLDFESI